MSCAAFFSAAIRSLMRMFVLLIGDCSAEVFGDFLYLRLALGKCMSLLVGLIGFIGIVIGTDIFEHILQAIDGLLDEGLVVLGDGDRS